MCETAESLLLKPTIAAMRDSIRQIVQECGSFLSQEGITAYLLTPFTVKWASAYLIVFPPVDEYAQLS